MKCLCTWACERRQSVFKSNWIFDVFTALLQYLNSVPLWNDIHPNQGSRLALNKIRHTKDTRLAASSLRQLGPVFYDDAFKMNRSIVLCVKKYTVFLGLLFLKKRFVSTLGKGAKKSFCCGKFNTQCPVMLQTNPGPCIMMWHVERCITPPASLIHDVIVSLVTQSLCQLKHTQLLREINKKLCKLILLLATKCERIYKPTFI